MRRRSEEPLVWHLQSCLRYTVFLHRVIDGEWPQRLTMASSEGYHDPIFFLEKGIYMLTLQSLYQSIHVTISYYNSTQKTHSGA